MKFLQAWRFLTAIPLPGWRQARPDETGNSLVYFPIIGIIIGLLLFGIAWTLSLLLPQAVISILIILGAIVLTGALHLDGLADTCDGLSGSTVEERLSIMKDSRTGSFGVTGIVCIILIKVISLTAIPQEIFLKSLILMPVIGRSAIVYTVAAFPYARPSGTGRLFKDNAGWLSPVIAALVILLVAIALFQWAGLIIVAIVFAVVTGIALFFTKRLGGLTGDVYGAINEIAEATVLVIIVLLATQQWLGM